MIATLASIGLPGLNGFIGEFLILNGSFSSALLGTHVFVILGATGVILAAVYMLWMYQRVFFGPIKHEVNKKLADLNAREIGLLIPLVIMMIWIGVRSSDFTQYSEAQVKQLLETTSEKGMAIRQSADSNELPSWAGRIYDVTNELASTK